MKYKVKRLGLISAIALVFSMPASARDAGTGTIDLTTEFTYKAAAADSKDVSKALALFRAKFKAVELAAKYFTHKGLLEHYGNRQNEIFCLAADEIDSAVGAENYAENRAEYTVKIRSTVRVIDFMQAEIKNLELERIEYGFSYDQEMEQHVSKSVEPGQELSRAYRYIRQKQRRIAVIYLNHLQEKYPNWGDVYLAKAIAYYSLHDVDKMFDALKTACAQDYPEACKELQSLGSDPDMNPKME